MNTPSIIWLKNGRILKQVDDTVTTIPALDKKVYNMGYDMDRNEILLEEFADEFHFDSKIYGLESKLVEHIMKTYENTKGNIGILFNGTKGTGKTWTAKVIANKMNLPVILINAPYPGLGNFIAKINCPCILFFDEFEKNFNTEKKEDVDILSIMDGVYNSPYRRIFLLTTNKLYVNENLIGRPSRIRYRKSFGNLTPEVVREYMDDNLERKEFAEDILTFIDSLAISTIDILKSVVEEVNIHGVSPDTFKNFLNVEQAKYSYDTLMYYGRGGITEFKKEIARLGTTEKDEVGEEYVVDEDCLRSVDTRTVNTSTSVDFLQIGDEFGGYGRITEPLDLEGFLHIEDDYGRKRVFKILNIETKPSLYRGSLVY